MTCRQVVNAYQDDRVQDDDLTRKHDFLSRTHGTEQMPRSAVFLALCVSNVFFFFFYDGGGGGGEVLCCRVVCHRSNEATTNARLVFIADEGLGIDPAVQIGGVAVPFHQSLRFVEGAVQHFTEIVDQSVHGRIGGVNLVYGEHLFAPIRHVVFSNSLLNLLMRTRSDTRNLGMPLP